MRKPRGSEVRAAVIGAIVGVLGAKAVAAIDGVFAAPSDSRTEIVRLDGRINQLKTENDTRWEDVQRSLRRIEDKLDRDRIARSKETP